MAYDDVCRAGDSNSIVNNNCKAARDGEILLWQALCDEANTAMDYIDADAVIMNPLLHPEHSYEALSAHSTPTLSEALEKLSRTKRRWTSYHMHKHNPTPAYGQPAMMAVQIMYKVTLIREGSRRHHHHHHHHHHRSEKKAEGESEESEDQVPNLQTVNAFCTSTWKQDASGGWKLSVQQLVPVSS